MMKRPYSNNGFTLVEMIISLAVFSVVAVVALGALTKIVSANRKAQTLQTSITNLNFALDAMSRELRTGHKYACEENNGALGYQGEDLEVDPCPGGFSSNASTDAILAFRSSKVLTRGAGQPCPAAYAYRFKHNGSEDYTLEKAVQTDCGVGIQDSNFHPLLDENLKISGYYMSVDASGDYPLLTLRISGYAGVKEREKTYFNIQTSVAPHVKR